MLLSRGDIPYVSTMFAKLQHFCRISGLSISSDKSAIYSASIRPHELSHIQPLIGFSLGDFPFRYLGVPLLSSRLNVCHFAPLLSKITGLIQGWSRKSLSYAGKLELIRAVIQGIMNFWMGIFPLPQFVLDRINASCRNFLWGKADIGKNKPLVAWSNLALLSRILWDFHCKKDSLWVRWVHHYYFRGSDVWNYNTSSSDSVLIKKIIQIRDFIISKELSTEEAKKRIQSWSTNEQLLVGKVYEYIRGVKPAISWCSVIWNPTIPPKMNRLLTLDKVAFLNKGSLCPLCSNEAESNAHLLFSCRKSLQIWAHIRDLAPFRRRFTSLQRITNSLIRGRSTSAITIYCIWLSRNKLIFEDYQFYVIEVISKIKFLMYRQAHLLHLCETHYFGIPMVPNDDNNSIGNNASKSILDL
ncbi:putative ribonuclease H protein [Glycine max]|nr:putative ribonuclease H protein [Glycine max]